MNSDVIFYPELSDCDIRGDFYWWEKDNIVIKLAVRNDSDNLSNYEEEQHFSDLQSFFYS